MSAPNGASPITSAFGNFVGSLIDKHVRDETGKDVLRNLVEQLSKTKTVQSNTSDELLSMIKKVNPELVLPVLTNTLLKLGLSEKIVKLLEKKFIKEGTLDVDTLLNIAQSLQDQEFDQKFVIKLMKSLDLNTIFDLLKYKNKELLVIQQLLGGEVPDFTKLSKLLVS